MKDLHIPDIFVRLCKSWHGGQSSMLYAIASTGNLTPGSRRPCDCDGTPWTDTQWRASLYSDLYRELSSIVRHLEEYPAHDVEGSLPILREFRDWADRVSDDLTLAAYPFTELE